MTAGKLSALPPISFAPQDTAAIERDVLGSYERITQQTLYPGVPERLMCEALAYREAVVNSAIDLAGKMSLLAFAKGEHLDHLGAFMGVRRLTPAPARTTLRFALAEPLAFAVPIPKGVRVAPRDGSINFATAFEAVIPAGEPEAAVTAIALESGAAGNGLVAGQVNSLVDRLPYIAEVGNTTVTLGGSDIENDEHFRERVRLAPESYSNAGSEGAYRFHVLSVHADIVAVAVDTPEPGVVDVRPVLIGGELPDATLLDLVRDKLSERDVRPLTDKVLVAAPDPVEYAVSGSWHLRRADAALLAPITAAVAQALETYRLWQRCEPGRDVNPTRLISLVEQAGAKRVELEQPVFTPLSRVRIARETTLDLRFAGVEDE